MTFQNARLSPLALAALACCSTLARAQLQTIEVTAAKDRYAPIQTQAATRSPVPVEQVPQSVISIPRSIIEDQASKTVSDVLRNVSNVNEIDPRDSNNVGFKIRGFNAAMVVDGVSIPGWFQNQESLVGVQQIDVIKGPAGGLYGSGQAIGNYSTVGGTIAVTTKSPAAKAFREVGIKWGTYGRRQAHFDVNQPLNSAWAFRINGETDRSDSETQGVFFRKTALNPSLAWSPDAKTKVVIKARMLDNTTVDFSGLPRANTSSYEPSAGLTRSTFVTATGLPDTTQKSRGLNVQWTQVLNDDWTFKALAARNTAEVDQRGVFPFPVSFADHFQGSVMSEPSAFGFGQFVPGFDFLQNLSKNAAQPAGSAMPGMGSWVAPTLSIEDIDKRIQELKSVLFWLEQNTTALKATIQALEVQKMTLTTLQTMNVNMADLAKAFTAKVPEPTEPAPTPVPTPAASPFASAAAAQDPAAAKPSLFTPKPASVASAPAPEAPAEVKPEVKPEVSQPAPEAAANAAPAVDPMQWWGALTQQFQGIAAAAMKDVAGEALKASEMAKQQAKQQAKKAARSSAKGAANPPKTTLKPAPKSVPKAAVKSAATTPRKAAVTAKLQPSARVAPKSRPGAAAAPRKSLKK